MHWVFSCLSAKAEIWFYWTVIQVLNYFFQIPLLGRSRGSLANLSFWSSFHLLLTLASPYELPQIVLFYRNEEVPICAWITKINSFYSSTEKKKKKRIRSSFCLSLIIQPWVICVSSFVSWYMPINLISQLMCWFRSNSLCLYPLKSIAKHFRDELNNSGWS